MIQPWYDKKFNEHVHDNLCHVRLKFCFTIDEMPASPVYLAMEDYAKHRVKINGKTLQGPSEKGWIDICFDTVEIPSANLRTGENTIEITSEFNSGADLEGIYLLGRFGVKLPATLIRLPEFLRQGDIGGQGLPFYSGSILYRTGIKNKDVRLEFKELNCALAIVRSGAEEKYIVCAPYVAELCVTDEMVIECVFTRRNTFGPHHNLPYPDISYPPACFVSEGEHWTDDYVLEKQGICLEDEKK